jgi:hypothetical protein
MIPQNSAALAAELKFEAEQTIYGFSALTMLTPKIPNPKKGIPISCNASPTLTIFA